MTPLKLRGQDLEDLQVVSSTLQDALVAVRDMGYLPDQRRFALVFNRFCWEVPADADGKFRRVHCALAFDEVRRVSMRDIDRGIDDRILSLLSIEGHADAATGAFGIQLNFAGKPAIRLEVDRLLCHLEDVGEPWPTAWRPAHRLD